MQPASYGSARCRLQIKCKPKCTLQVADKVQTSRILSELAKLAAIALIYLVLARVQPPRASCPPALVKNHCGCGRHRAVRVHALGFWVANTVFTCIKDRVCKFALFMPLSISCGYMYSHV